MRFIKYGFIVGILFFFLACEKDQICVEENTPYLIIRFYDYNYPEETKPVLNLKVQIDGIDQEYTNETIKQLTDSIAIPIDAGKDVTTYRLTLNGSDDNPDNDNTDVLEIRYTREDVFVSRSCGFKTIFHDVQIETDGGSTPWMLSVKPESIPLNIVNERADHVKVFH